MDEVLRRYIAESFRNSGGIGLMVASVVLRISERVSDEVLVATFVVGLLNLFIGAIFIRGVKDG
ncbi:MAG: hypothetical protein Q9N34_09130 [Aquificota bacterium]|nr:hypothetical protein [Aquificota bacterium]